MDEIKPVAWRINDSTFVKEGGGDWTWEASVVSLYDQQAIDTLREQVNRLFLSGRDWATRFGEQEARAERAEAEVERLKEVCDKWSERELLFGAHEDLQARAERAEVEADALRKDAERYRAMRDNFTWSLSNWPGGARITVHMPGMILTAVGPDEDEFDAAIDAATKEQG